jgi:AmiR/NasT family two-component response regulator
MKNPLDDEQRRAVVAKAKAMLISRNGWDEREAHRFLQLKSMNSRKPLAEIAEAFLLAEELSASI